VGTTWTGNEGKVRGPFEADANGPDARLWAANKTKRYAWKVFSFLLLSAPRMQRLQSAVAARESGFVVVGKRWGAMRERKWVGKRRLGKKNGGRGCHKMARWAGRSDHSQGEREHQGTGGKARNIGKRKIRPVLCCLRARSHACTGLPKWDIKCALAAALWHRMASFDWPVVIRYRSRKMLHLYLCLSPFANLICRPSLHHVHVRKSALLASLYSYDALEVGRRDHRTSR
jgi:hypothetical protein